jgi:SAM-dependent methyltransferase
MELLLILFFFFLLVFAVFFSVQFYNILFRGFAPYLNTHGQTIKAIISHLDLKGNECFYELGCGSAGFLQEIARRFPQSRSIGFEYSFLPYLIAKLQIKLHGYKNITIKRKNIFKIDLKEADVIYCYLNIDTMAKLKEKFKKECRPGARIISYKFPVPGWEPKGKLKSEKAKIYFYKD